MCGITSSSVGISEAVGSLSESVGSTKLKLFGSAKLDPLRSPSTTVAFGMDEVDGSEDLTAVVPLKLETSGSCLNPISRSDVSLVDGVSWFNFGMRTATEFLRLPNTVCLYLFSHMFSFSYHSRI